MAQNLIDIEESGNICLTPLELDFLSIKVEEVIRSLQATDYQRAKLYLFSNYDEYLTRCRMIIPSHNLMGSYRHSSAYVYADLLTVSREKLIHCIMHELTHIIYDRYVKKVRDERIIWVSEGIAQNFSGEMTNLEDEDNLKSFLTSKVYADGKIVPDISYLQKYGRVFGSFIDCETNKYNGYNWSYLMIRYLKEISTNKEFNSLIRDYSYLKENEGDILINTNKHFLRKIK